MSFLKTNTVTQIVLLLVIGIIYFAIQYYAKQGKTWKVRRLAGVDAIEEAVGRATELNRPVAFFPGEGKLQDAKSGDTIAAVAILTHVTRLCARLGTPMFVHTHLEETVPLLQDVCQNAYMLEGKEDAYDPVTTVRYIGSGTQAYLYGVNLFHIEHIAVNMLFGDLGIESLTMAEEGNRLGAVGIAGSTRISNVAFLVAAMDYVVLSDELFAAAAYVSGDPVQISTVSASDIIKIGVILLAILGPILVAAGVDLPGIYYPS